MKKFELFKDESLKMTLEETERQNMRESLLAYMEKTPIREPVLAESRAHDRSYSKLFAFLIICLIITIGVVYVARRGGVTNTINVIKAEMLGR